MRRVDRVRVSPSGRRGTCLHQSFGSGHHWLSNWRNGEMELPALFST